MNGRMNIAQGLALLAVVSLLVACGEKKEAEAHKPSEAVTTVVDAGSAAGDAAAAEDSEAVGEVAEAERDADAAAEDGRPTDIVADADTTGDGVSVDGAVVDAVRKDVSATDVTGADGGDAVADPKAKVEPEPEPKPTPKVEPKPEPKPKPKVEPKPEPKVEPKPEPKVEPKPEPKVEPKPEPKVEPKPAATAPPADPCKRTTFATSLIKSACKRGQGAAKSAMRGFMKKAKKAGIKVTCKTCHSALGPDYPLTSDGLSKYREFSKTIKAAKGAHVAPRDLPAIAAWLRTR